MTNATLAIWILAAWVAVLTPTAVFGWVLRDREREAANFYLRHAADLSARLARLSRGEAPR